MRGRIALRPVLARRVPEDGQAPDARHVDHCPAARVRAVPPGPDGSAKRWRRPPAGFVHRYGPRALPVRPEQRAMTARRTGFPQASPAGRAAHPASGLQSARPPARAAPSTSRGESSPPPVPRHAPRPPSHCSGARHRTGSGGRAPNASSGAQPRACDHCHRSPPGTVPLPVLQPGHPDKPAGKRAVHHRWGPTNCVDAHQDRTDPVAATPAASTRGPHLHRRPPSGSGRSSRAVRLRALLGATSPSRASMGRMTIVPHTHRSGQHATVAQARTLAQNQDLVHVPGIPCHSIAALP